MCVGVCLFVVGLLNRSSVSVCVYLIACVCGCLCVSLLGCPFFCSFGRSCVCVFVCVVVANVCLCVSLIVGRFK